MPYKNEEFTPLFDADLAGCQMQNAAVMARPAGGVMYSVVCRDTDDEMLARLTAAASAGNSIRILFREARVVFSDVTIHRLEASTFRIAGRVLLRDAQQTTAMRDRKIIAVNREFARPRSDAPSGWDPNEVWRTRVLLPRLAESNRQAQEAFELLAVAARMPGRPVDPRRDAGARRVALTRLFVQIFEGFYLLIAFARRARDLPVCQASSRETSASVSSRSSPRSVQR